MNTVIVGGEKSVNYTLAKALAIHFFKKGQWTAIVEYQDERFFLERSLDLAVKDPKQADVKFDNVDNVVFYVDSKDLTKFRAALDRLSIRVEREIAITDG